jgi:hypothetical protein
MKAMRAFDVRQLSLRFLFHANASVNGRSVKNAVLVLTEHTIVVLHLGKKSAKIVDWIHLFAITALESSEKRHMTIKSDERQFDIDSELIELFFIELARRYEFCSSGRPKEARWKLHLWPGAPRYPPFPLLPSEQFQLSFSAYCSLHARIPLEHKVRTHYKHDVATYHYAQLAYRNFSLWRMANGRSLAPTVGNQQLLLYL